MSKYLPEIEGGEFDWYAKDTQGNIGLFSTGGRGFVHDAVVETLFDHDQVTESLAARELGKPSVWPDYAALGFYVYDWSWRKKCYERYATPSDSAQQDVLSIVNQLDCMPVLNINFSNTELVADV